MRVLYVGHILGISETHVKILGKYLNPRLFEMDVCIWGPVGARSKESNAPNTYVLSYDLDLFEELVKKNRYDVIFLVRAGGFNPYEAKILESAKRHAIPCITEWNTFGMYDKSPSSNAIDLHFMGGKTVALFYRWFSGLSVADWVKKCRVVYWPVDVNQIVSNRPNPGEILQMREELGVGSEDFVIGRYGRADPAKWDSIPIETFRILLRHVPSAKLLIVGGVPAEIWKLVKKWGLEGNVVVKEPELDYAKYVKLYYLPDVYFHTSRIGEAFSRTIIDAMAAQRPVVVNSTPYAVNGQIEQVDNEVSGFVADTPRTLAAAIAYLFEHPEVASKMGENGLLKVKSRFDAPIIASCLMKFWIDVLSSKGFKFSEHEQQAVDRTRLSKGEDFSDYESEYNQRLHAKFHQPTVRDLLACNVRYLWFARNIRMKVKILESRYLPLSIIKHRSDIASPTRSLNQLHTR